MVKKLSMEELIKKNKEEFLKDKDLLDKIEKRLEQKYVKQSEYIGGDK
ncbi:FbpB family small basic protein [Bacillus sp. UMB0899]|nr:FbpB family small basic protein [Metabacillus schmidteae]PMC40694.1 FbpB family small basic protein [Bacillus sp. UMB0899]